MNEETVQRVNDALDAYKAVIDTASQYLQHKMSAEVAMAHITAIIKESM